MRQDAQKPARKFCRSKEDRKQQNAPGKARKRRNRVRFGCWRGWERLWAGANGWESLAIGQKDLVSAAASVGPGRSPPGCRPPRHAVLEWMWESAPGSGKRPMSSGSLRKSQRGRCWFGAVSSFWRRIVYRLPLLPSKEKHLRQKDGQADQDHGRVGPGGI